MNNERREKLENLLRDYCNTDDVTIEANEIEALFEGEKDKIIAKKDEHIKYLDSQVTYWRERAKSEHPF